MMYGLVEMFFGHNDVDSFAQDPGFSVPQYILSTFNRKNGV